MAISGLRHTENFAADERPLNWREGILRLYPNGTAPLTALTALMKSKSTDDAEFNWWEKELYNPRLVLSGAIDGSVTTIPVVANARQTKTGSLLYVEGTGEIMRVASTPTIDTSLTVVRGVAGTSAAAVAAPGNAVNSNLMMMASAYEENSNAPSGVSLDPTKVFNFTQIFRDTLEMSRTAQKTRLRTGDQVKEAKRECLEIHSTGMERAFFFGSKQETTLNGKPLRYTGGVLSFIAAANKPAPLAAPCDMMTLEAHLEAMFRFGSSEKIAFGGNRAMLVIQQIIRKNSSFQIMSGIKEYGMNVSRLVTPFGELVIKTHPLFNQLTSGVSPATWVGMDANLVVLDQKEIVYRYVDDTKYEPKLQTNDLDGMQSGYLSECGLEVHFPKAHYYLRGLTAAAVDP